MNGPVFEPKPERLISHGRRGIAAGLLLGMAAGLGALCSTAKAETPPKPWVRFPLRDFGFPGHSSAFLHAGMSMETVHLLDGSHLLFTYSMRTLVPRLPGDDVNDTDRQVAAVLVSLPSGKVLARTQWHLHDHGQYLWSVGRGVLVLRVGSELSVLAPVRGIRAGDAFRRYALPHGPGQPKVVTGSPDGQIVTVQLESRKDDADAVGYVSEAQKPKHVLLQFFRLKYGPEPEDSFRMTPAGVVGSPVLLRLALDGDGYMWADDARRGRWQVSFNEYGGKQQNITPLLSSCAPRLQLLSRSEFLASTCRGADDSPVLVAYGFDGHENWEEHLSTTLVPPSFSLAPTAGRFAMGRLLPGSPSTPVSTLVSDDPINEEIRVYQTGSGNLLLKLQCVPAVRTEENFDLSPDGTVLAVVGKETLDLYHLPELSARDKQDLAEAETMRPPVDLGPVRLEKITRPLDPQEKAELEGVQTEMPAAGEAAAGSTSPSPAPAVSAPEPVGSTGAAVAAGRGPDSDGQGSSGGGLAAPHAAASARTTQASAGDDSGGEESAGPRKPPTLLRPGETVGYKTDAASPK